MFALCNFQVWLSVLFSYGVFVEVGCHLSRAALTNAGTLSGEIFAYTRYEVQLADASGKKEREKEERKLCWKIFFVARDTRDEIKKLPERQRIESHPSHYAQKGWEQKKRACVRWDDSHWKAGTLEGSGRQPTSRP